MSWSSGYEVCLSPGRSGFNSRPRKLFFLKWINLAGNLKWIQNSKGHRFSVNILGKENFNGFDVWEACQVWGGAPGAPPIYLSRLWSDFQNSFFWWKLVKIVIDFYSIGDFLSFTAWPLEVAEVTKVHRVKIFMQKMKFRNFWATSMLYTSKERIFQVEFKFKQKKYGSLVKNLKKIEFFHFWVKNEADQVSSMASFSNFLTTNLKNGFARSW